MNTSSTPWRPLSRLPYVLGEPRAQGIIRACPEDFRVDEILGFEPDQTGEHRLLQIRKRNTNTEWVARRLAGRAGVPQVDVSYAGLKDRYAVTTQWFSVRLAGRPEPDWGTLEGEDVQVLQIASHGRKLRRGALKGNRFRIRLRELSGQCSELIDRLERIKEAGIANYFGEQRFGHDYGNLGQAEALFSGARRKLSRYRRGLYLSAVRSQLFNEILGRRVEDGTWNLPLAGDLLSREDDDRLLRVAAVDRAMLADVRDLRLHPTGPLWGRGNLPSDLAVKQLEEESLADFHTWRQGLEQAGLKQARRPLRVGIRDLCWEWLEKDVLELAFRLPAGSYATMVLRELIGSARP